MDGIMQKWANPHFDDFEEKIVQQHEVQDKTNRYKLTQKGNKISDQMSNPECETRIFIKLLLSMTYIFIVFLMWVSPLVHDAIQMEEK